MKSMRIIAIAWSVACAGTAWSTVINVPGDYPTIADALAAATSGDEVVVAPGTYAEYGLSFDGKELELRSSDPADPAVVAATVIDAGGQGTLLDITHGEAGATALRGFTLTGAVHADGRLLGIDSGASPLVEYCVFADNDVSGSVPTNIIQISGSATALFRDCTWRDNVGSWYGCASIYGETTFERCTFSNNHSGNFGQIQAWDTQVDFIDCTFSGNSVGGMGGAIFVKFGSGTFTDCTFINNVCGDTGGGAIASENATIQISGTVFDRNRTTGNADGGAYYNWYCDAVIDHCTFNGNSSGGDGVAIWTHGGTMELKSSILWHDGADALHNDWGTTLTVNWSDLQGDWGGSGNLDTDPEFCLVDCDTTDIMLSAVSPCIGSGEGGSNMGALGVGCDLPQIHTPVTYTIPTDFPTIAAGVAATCMGDTLVLLPGTYNESGIEFGTHECFVRSTAPADSLVRATTVVDGGGSGPIFIYSSVDKIGSGLSGFTITGAGGSQDGGALHITGGAAPRVTQCRLIGNSISGNGAAAYVRNATPFFSECEISNNSGSNALYLYQSTDVALEHVTLSDNSGSAIRLDQASEITLFDCTLARNTATNGVAIMADRACQVDADSCRFDHNATLYSTGSGGVFYGGSNTSGTFVDCLFSDNSAGSGGVAAGGFSQIDFTDCEFSNNSAATDGGVVRHGGSIVMNFTGCNFTGNHAGDDGGVLALGSTKAAGAAPTLPTTFAYCTFSGNTAVGDGGVAMSGYGWLVLHHCILTGSSAYMGGALRFDRGSTQIDHCVFDGNSADYTGADIRITGEFSMQLLNSILRNGTPEEIYPNLPEYDVQYCNIEGGWTGTGNIDADPNYTTYQGYDYILMPPSPCIDSGTGGNDVVNWCAIHPVYCQYNSQAPDMGAYGGANGGWLPH